MQAMTFDKDNMIFFLGQLQGWTGQRNLESMIVSCWISIQTFCAPFAEKS